MIAEIFMWVYVFYFNKRKANRLTSLLQGKRDLIQARIKKAQDSWEEAKNKGLTGESGIFGAANQECVSNPDYDKAVKEILTSYCNAIALGIYEKALSVNQNSVKKLLNQRLEALDEILKTPKDYLK